MPLIGWIMVGLFSLGTGAAVKHPEDMGVNHQRVRAEFQHHYDSELKDVVSVPQEHKRTDDVAAIAFPVWK